MALVHSVRAVLEKRMGRPVHGHRHYTPIRIRRGEDKVPVIFIESSGAHGWGCAVHVPLRYFGGTEQALIYQSRLVVHDVVHTPHPVLETTPSTASPRDSFLSSHSVIFPSCTLKPTGDGGLVLSVTPSSRAFPLAEGNLFRLTPGLLDSVVDVVCAGVTGTEPDTTVVEIFMNGEYRGVFTLMPEPMGEYVADLVDLATASSVACFDGGERVSGGSHFLCARESPEKSPTFVVALSSAWADASRWDPTSVFLYALRGALTGGPRTRAVLEGSDAAFSTVRFLHEPAAQDRQPTVHITDGPACSVLAATGVAARVGASVAAALHHLTELEGQMRTDKALIAALSRDRLLRYPHEALASPATSANDDLWRSHIRDRAVSDLCAGIAGRLLIDYGPCDVAE